MSEYIFTLGKATETEKYRMIDDLVPIMIEQVYNKNKDKYIHKYMIHVNGDTYGLFSDKYVYCSTKFLVEKFKNFKMDRFFYYKGNITTYLESETSNNIPLDNETFRLLAALSDEKLEMFESDSKIGIYLINSYTGMSKILIGNYLKIQFAKEKSLFVKFALTDFSTSHIGGLLHKIENNILELDYITIDRINRISMEDAVKILQKYLTKKEYKKYESIKNEVGQLKPIHMLIFVAYNKINFMRENMLLNEFTQMLKTI